MSGIGMRGRKPQWEYVDGELVEIRAVMKMSNSLVFSLPKMWIDQVTDGGVKELKGVAITYNEEAVIVKPYFGENKEE